MANDIKYKLMSVVVLIIIVLGWWFYSNYHDQQIQQAQQERTTAINSCIAQQQVYYKPYLQAEMYNMANGGAQGTTQVLQEEQSAIRDCYNK